MKLLKDLRRTIDLFGLYFEAFIYESIAKVHEILKKKSLNNFPKQAKSRGKCKKCTRCSSKKKS